VARIPYADIDGDERRALVTKIVAQRGSVIHLYRMLLHTPPRGDGLAALPDRDPAGM
jgi:hypothetical protein